MICFYHESDLDGQCSGAIVKYKYPEVELYPIDYGKPFPWDDVQNERVFLVDFSLQPFEDMLRLKESCHLTWIDHHKSALEDAQGYTFEGTQRDGIGACALTWEYLFAGEVPRAIQYLALYDVWNHKDPSVLPFQYGMRLEAKSPEDKFWKELFENDVHVSHIVDVGHTVLRYQEQSNTGKMKIAFETEFEGLRAIAYNGLSNSIGFASVYDPEKHDIMMPFVWKNGSYTVSMFCDKDEIDVGTIAKSYGGGGHKGAAGFQTKNLPFELC